MTVHQTTAIPGCFVAKGSRYARSKALAFLFPTNWLLCLNDRHNQELEQDALAMDQEKAKLQQEADSLAQRLEAVLNDKFEPRTSFDADTPIDKTLNFLQSIIQVNHCGRTCSEQACLEGVNVHCTYLSKHFNHHDTDDCYDHHCCQKGAIWALLACQMCLD